MRSKFYPSPSEKRLHMKTHIVFVLIIASAVNAFAQQVLYCSGTVRDSSGAPVAGVRVELYPGFYIGAGHYTEVKTDANGRYEIIQQPELSGLFSGHPNPTNSIMARDFQKNLAAIQEFPGTTTSIDLILQPAITLTGSVKNTEGAPVNDAELEFRFCPAIHLPCWSRARKLMSWVLSPFLPCRRDAVTLFGESQPKAMARPLDVWKPRIPKPTAMNFQPLCSSTLIANLPVRCWTVAGSRWPGQV